MLKILMIGNAYPNKHHSVEGRIYSIRGLCPTLHTPSGGGMIPTIADNKESLIVRKLTPKECFRLQGWTDDYFEKAAFVCSDSQLYKQAGNGVTVPVAEEIGKRLIATEIATKGDKNGNNKK